jgi:hypothetical protein
MSHKIVFVLAVMMITGCGESQSQVSVENAVEPAVISNSAALQARLVLTKVAILQGSFGLPREHFLHGRP